MLAIIAATMVAGSTGCCCLERMFCCCDKPWACCDECGPTCGSQCDTCDSCGGCDTCGTGGCDSCGMASNQSGGCGPNGCGVAQGGCGHGGCGHAGCVAMPGTRNGAGYGPGGPPSPQVAYPYYTNRGPRDFLAKNPPSIGP
jgi:hypothetical protein